MEIKYTKNFNLQITEKLYSNIFIFENNCIFTISRHVNKANKKVIAV